MTKSPVLNVKPLGFPWETADPFLFCAYHDDAYPRGNGAMGPPTSLEGRHLGQDFSRKEGWSMYHGDTVPGFPAHPHRGFETVTVVRKGLIDHSDSLGATARFGAGRRAMADGRRRRRALRDVSAAGDRAGQSARTVPDLVEPAGAQQDGAAALHDVLARARFRGWSPRTLRAATPKSPWSPASSRGPANALPPPPDSWAAHPESDVAIWTHPHGARRALRAAAGGLAGTRRTLYFFKGGRRDCRRPGGEGPAAITLDAGVPVATAPRRRAERSSWCCRAGRSANRSRSTARS